jgi:hypothetical protein
VNEHHEELLRRIVLGELSADAAEVRAAAADAEFARELSETMRVVRALEQGDKLREAVLAEIDAGTDDAQIAQPRPRRRALWWVPLLAAGVVAASLAWLTWAKHDRAPDDKPLGSTWIVVDTPKGEVTDFSEFTWRSSALVGRFEIVVLDANARELDRHDIVGERAWKPDPAVHSRWPDRIRWTLEWRDDSDQQLKPLVSTEAWRRH